VRDTAVFNHLLALPGVWVIAVEFGAVEVVVDVRLRRRRLVCPHCGWSTKARHNVQSEPSTWRALDLGVWKVWVRATLRRLACPDDGVVVEEVPFACHGVRLTRDVNDLIAWLATKTDKTAVCRLLRVNWRTVGKVVQRVVACELDPGRLDDLYRIGVDEVSYRKYHHYLSLVTDHDAGTVVWAAEGTDADTLRGFFDELGADRAAQIEAVSLDMGRAYPVAVAERAPQAEICWDPFRIVAMANKALDEVRRAHWNYLRAAVDAALAKQFKGARWALLEAADRLSDAQTEQLAAIRRSGTAVWRAYCLEEALRAVFAGDRPPEQVAALLESWTGWAQRSRLQPFVKLARTLRAHHDGIIAATARGLSQGRAEGLNNRVRLIARRGFGFHSGRAVAALVLLSCGPITLTLPHER
jgi:transposase